MSEYQYGDHARAHRASVEPGEDTTTPRLWAVDRLVAPDAWEEDSQWFTLHTARKRRRQLADEHFASRARNLRTGVIDMTDRADYDWTKGVQHSSPGKDLLSRESEEDV